jgi:hypothetical protein
MTFTEKHLLKKTSSKPFVLRNIYIYHYAACFLLFKIATKTMKKVVVFKAECLKVGQGGHTAPYGDDWA